jgi:hypothetical protein
VRVVLCFSYCLNSKLLYHYRLLLLQRSDVDTSIKDLEGYTAFDLYNSTVNDTKPDVNDLKGDLFTWGANRYDNPESFFCC